MRHPWALLATVPAAALALLVQTGVLPAQERVKSGTGAVLRAIDKITGDARDIAIARGGQASYGRLRIILGDCRYPADNPESDAFALIEIIDPNMDHRAFLGWMVASSPALNALDHPRYDVWVLRCNRS